MQNIIEARYPIIKRRNLKLSFIPLITRLPCGRGSAVGSLWATTKYTLIVDRVELGVFIELAETFKIWVELPVGSAGAVDRELVDTF